MTKWTEDLTAQLRSLAGDESEEVSRETVASIAEELEISGRSVASKLRKEGYVVEKAGSAPSSFTEEETEALRELLEANEGELTYAELAERLGSDHSARAVQGKVLSMELTGLVRATPPKVVEKSFTDEQAATIVEMTRAGAFLEDIAAKVGKTVAQVRGKALSLLRAEEIDQLPVQRDRKPSETDAFENLGDKVSTMTVEELVEATGKTARGVKTILTRRKLIAKDYDGVAKAAKAQA